jgi:hypothetical protein
MNPLSIFFAKYKALVIIAALLAMCFASYRVGVKLERAVWQQKEAERKVAENAAILTRIKNNERKTEQDKLNSARIAKEHKRELDQVRSDIAAERLRVGPNFCPRSAEGAEANSPGSGDGADPGGRLLLEEVDRNLKALMDAMEGAAATGRAAQEFIRSNGMAPE